MGDREIMLMALRWAGSIGGVCNACSCVVATPELKQEAATIFKACGLDLSAVIRLFLRSVVL
jgi:hypothetical protein